MYFRQRKIEEIRERSTRRTSVFFFFFFNINGEAMLLFLLINNWNSYKEKFTFTNYSKNRDSNSYMQPKLTEVAITHLDLVVVKYYMTK